MATIVYNLFTHFPQFFMTKFLSAAIVIGSMTTMFWYTYVPNGVEFCASGAQFRPAHEEWESNVQAAKVATSQFCGVVRDYPM